MNAKISSFLLENLTTAFSLPKYSTLRSTFNEDTDLDSLPWTPAKKQKFIDTVSNTLTVELQFPCGTIKDATNKLDSMYLHKFFGQVWKPHTEDYYYTGRILSEEVNKHSPRNVLDVGCGYNEFKKSIPNLVGIDPYNNASDYMVDILDFVSTKKFDAIMALGSINFGSDKDIDEKFAKCVSLLADDGRFYLRVNPGKQHVTGPWVEIFNWTFRVAATLAEKYNLHLESFKTDLDRKYIVYHKLLNNSN